MKNRHSKTMAFDRDFQKSVFYTLLLIVVFRLGQMIPLPFINTGALQEYENLYGLFDRQFTAGFSIFSLGLIPYLSAYILVEIGSLFLPVFKNWRRENMEGRRKLRRSALWLALFLSVWQASAIIDGLKSTMLPNGAEILKIHGMLEHAVVTATLAGGVFFLVFLCDLVSRKGIGNGISILILSGICAGGFGSLTGNLYFFKETGVLPSLVIGAAFAGLVALCCLFLKARRPVALLRQETGVRVRYFEMNLCPSGYVALEYAGSLIMLPLMTLYFLSEDGYIPNVFSPGEAIYETVSAIAVVLLSILFAYLFFHPFRRFEDMRQHGWEFPDASVPSKSGLRRLLMIISLPWTAFLALLAILPALLAALLDVPFMVGGASVLLSTAIALDISDRLAFFKAGVYQPVRIAEFHDVYQAGMIKNHLSAKKISCHLQGYCHRKLLFFLGPYIEIALLVSEADAEAAMELIRSEYGGAGLLI